MKENEGDQLSCFSVNAGHNRGLLKTLDIKGVPTFLFYQDGQLVSSLVGAELTRDELVKRIRDLLQD